MAGAVVPLAAMQVAAKGRMERPAWTGTLIVLASAKRKKNLAGPLRHHRDGTGGGKGDVQGDRRRCRVRWLRSGQGLRGGHQAGALLSLEGKRHGRHVGGRSVNLAGHEVVPPGRGALRWWNAEDTGAKGV